LHDLRNRHLAGRPVIVKRSGDDAMLEAAARAEQLLNQVALVTLIG